MFSPLIQAVIGLYYTDFLIVRNIAPTCSILTNVHLATDGANSAALNVLRLPLGASDFSASAYTFDDVWNDYSLSSFNINNAPSYVWSTLADIKSVTQYLKLIVVPWSAPAWMKSSYSLYGGTLISGYETMYAQYIFKAIQAMSNKGLTPYAVSCQNEPQNSNPTYPTMLLPVQQEALVGRALRSLLDSNGFSYIKIMGYDHNWDNAGSYPVSLVRAAPFHPATSNPPLLDESSQQRFLR